MGFFVQDRVYYETEWAIVAADAVFGIIGGFIGLIWSLLALCLGGYESFKMTEAFIREIYFINDKDIINYWNVPNNFDEALGNLSKNIKSRERYSYSYLEYSCSRFLECFSCCCKDVKCHKLRMKRL